MARARPSRRIAIMGIVIVICVGGYLAWLHVATPPQARFAGVEEFTPGSGWKQVGEPMRHGVLRDGVVVVWADQTNSGGARLATMEVGGHYFRIRSALALRVFVSPVTSLDDAIAISDLVRMLIPVRQKEWGVLLRPAEGRIPEDARGRSGWYTMFDCERWRVPYEPAGQRASDGSFAVQRIATRIKPGGWQLQVVLMKDVVSRDGSFSTSLLRVLEEDGTDYDRRWL